jgi:hypothetical protein
MSVSCKAEIFVSRAIDARTSSIIALSVNYIAHVVTADGAYVQGLANAETLDHLNDGNHYVSLGMWQAPEFRVVLTQLRAAMLMQPRATPLAILQSLSIDGLSLQPQFAVKLQPLQASILTRMGLNIDQSRPVCVGSL